MDGSGGRSRLWREMFLIGILFSFFIGQGRSSSTSALLSKGSSIYFSQPEVAITRTFIPESGFLYVVKATAKPNEDGQIQYTISKPVIWKKNGIKSGGNATAEVAPSKGKCLELIIDKNLGNISVSRLPPQEIPKDLSIGQAGLACAYTVTASLDGKSVQNNGEDDVAEMIFNLRISSPLVILPENLDECKSLPKKELCFGGANHLELRVMENAPVTPVAYLGSLPGMCGTLKVSYNVSIAEGVLSATKARNYQPLSDIIQTKADLDREEVEVYNMSVTCILEQPDEPNKIELIQIGGRLVVLDENDNVLAVGEDSVSEVTIAISLSDHQYKMTPGTRLLSKEHSDLLAIDKDTVDVNNFRIYSINDTKGLLDFDLILYPYMVTGIENATANILKIVLSKHVTEIQPWDGYYCVLAVVNDSTVVVSKRGQELKYTICVTWGQEPHLPKPSERPSADDLLFRLSRRVVEAHLPRSAQKYAPVLYPFPDLIEDWSEAVAGLDFTLTHLFATVEETAYVDSNNNSGDDMVLTSTEYAVNVFDVTPKMGIIHLIQPEFIRNSSFQSFHLQLHCNSSLIPPFSTNITITLESPVSNETLCDDELCSEHADSKSCELSCGYGSPGKCMWRHEAGFNNSLSTDEPLDQYNIAPGYPTCSPHLGSCPDGKCDEMENLIAHLCPQDCGTEIRGFARLIKHGSGKSHGIDGQYCKGVGTCQDAHTCSCAHLPLPIVDSSTSPGHRPPGGSNLAFSTPAVSECGQQCVMTFLAISLIAVAFIMLSLYVWKARADRKRKSRSINQSVMMTANGIEIPYGDNNGHGTLISEAEYIARGLNHATMLGPDDQFSQHQIVQVDSKWEISRDDLLLEHILGEGQYGRVLKGRLHGNSGGHIPVAVKMLKVDATERSKSLWQEFMAEFSLLKQVDHPNVIKLLGACTTTGGPPYLVMEYAEYGALRSFLRKCRRVEKINGSHSALHWDHGDLSNSPNSDPLDLDYIVTPREVLGFSWQIAKGMAYLSDMKMVHRDLAARNILLTKLKVCKISDFGLTRDIYVDDAYQKKSKDRVPVKWLAPECLADELYTTKSDVWAFGILVWELTTLGASPYPGIQTEQLYSLLNAGYRMPQPHNCSNELYSLMRRCWAYTPSNRPTFHQIVLELSKMLEDGIEYLKLDVPSVSNPGYDYFSQSERTGSEMVNLSPTDVSPITDARQHGRRKVSMENLRLIDYEISTNDEFLSKRNSDSHSSTKHTYINEPKHSEQDCSSSKPTVVSSSGYESPIRSATSVAV